MPSDLTAINTRGLTYESIFLNIVGLAFIYSVPSLSHLMGVQIYLIEPMRIMLILAIAHTTKRNAFIIALTLPLFSFFTSAHPIFYKSVIMTAELLLNVWLFYFLATKFKNYFASMVISIIVSKAFYYVLKFSLISYGLIDSSLISTPLYLQIITMVIFSFYLFLVFSRREAEPPKFVDPTK